MGTAVARSVGGSNSPMLATLVGSAGMMSMPLSLVGGLRVEAFPGDLCLDQDVAHRTYSHYVQAFEQFC